MAKSKKRKNTKKSSASKKTNKINKVNKASASSSSKTTKSSSAKTPVTVVPAAEKQFPTKSDDKKPSTQDVIVDFSEPVKPLELPQSPAPAPAPAPDSDSDSDSDSAPTSTQTPASISHPTSTPDSSSKNQRKSKHPVLRVISRIISLLAIASFGYLLFRIASSKILPEKFLFPSIAGSFLAGAILLFFIFSKKRTLFSLLIIDVLSILLIAMSVFLTLKFTSTIDFINQNFSSNSKAFITYNIIVNNDSPFDSIEDIDNEIVYTYRDLILDSDTIATAIYQQTNASVSFKSDLPTLAGSVLNDYDQIIALSTASYETINDTYTNYRELTRIIGTIKIELDLSPNTPTDKITEHSFVLYISGIDTRENAMPALARSDVNILAVINPKTRQLLLVSVPRDTYVQLHGTDPTKDLKDKLTHAGSMGGVNLSRTTLEDFFGFKIDYYARVNFNFLSQLVDAIGGIDINNVEDVAITTNYGKCTFKPGWNYNVNGKCALGFARERKSYANGDIHRGENQEHVIAQLLAKATSSTTLINNYDAILNAINGTFETNLTSENITDFIQMHLADLTPWHISTSNINGTSELTYTYSYQGQRLYVMHPDMSTVETAKSKIQEVLGQ